MIGSELLRYRKKQKYLVFDKETCHLNLAVDNYPWQVAWLVATQNEILETHNHFMAWDGKLNVSDGAARATGFDPQYVARYSENQKDVYKKFRSYLDNPEYIIVGHNLINFDIYIEKLWANAVEEPHSWEYLNRLVDTNAVAKAIKKGVRPEMDNFLAWQFKMIGLVEKGLKTNLGLLMKEYKLEVDENRLHKADYDIEKNMELWNKQMWEIEI